MFQIWLKCSPHKINLAPITIHKIKYLLKWLKRLHHRLIRTASNENIVEMRLEIIILKNENFYSSKLSNSEKCILKWTALFPSDGPSLALYKHQRHNKRKFISCCHKHNTDQTKPWAETGKKDWLEINIVHKILISNPVASHFGGFVPKIEEENQILYKVHIYNQS